MSSYRKFWNQLFLDEHEDFMMIYNGLLLFSFLVFMALTFKLWGIERSYPMVAYFEIFDVPLIIHQVLSASLLLSLIWGFFSKKAWTLLLSVVLMICLGLTDALRIQPYLYELSLLIGLLGLYRLKLKSFDRDQWLLASQLVIAGLYIWAGIYKINAHFFTGTLPWIMSPLVNLLPDWEEGITLISMAAPFFEILLGLALLSKKLRPFAVWAAALFHIFILFLIGPFGLGWNSTVWFWDFLQILLVFVLFYPDRLGSFKNLLSIRKSLITAAVALLVLVMPALAFLNHWPHYMSSSVYTGTDIRAYLLFDEYVLKSLPTEMQRMTTENTNSGYQISFLDWTLTSNNAAPVPELWSYMKMFLDYCAEYQQQGEFSMALITKPSLFEEGVEQSQVSCPGAAG